MKGTIEMKREKEDLTVELDEKELRRIKKSARRKAMIREKFDPTTKVHKNKERYNRKGKHKRTPVDDAWDEFTEDMVELIQMEEDLGLEGWV